MCCKNSPAVHLPDVPSLTAYSAAQSMADDSTEEKESLYSPDKLLLPAALLSPIPSYQFGWIEVLACFLFAVFAAKCCPQCKARPFSVANSYLHILFLSVILIHAP
ncbi:hypothetical protein Q0590_24725 [Rhodocytophaga aerolata]|uniref:Uncharacterized protein n=2 Tax=Rhodocytophaga aerolata TaxID=455078 RepID=A0ABT8RBN1_9BACT|nr:hypothetical protein [Rhodocytophaga aerolata]MDO1449504.1 hypothetical protein [Rhodocytophaga aerolata]